jgi:predicted dehydrogenase
MAGVGLGIIGCGDFLRWQEADIRRSTRVRVRRVFDTDPSRSAKWAAKLDAQAAASVEELLADPSVDVAAVLVPPWARPKIVQACAVAGKHVITTKPLAPEAAACDAMVAAIKQAGVRAAVLYNRSCNPEIETLKAIFDSGELGRCVLYKQDWIHHYPQWNDWATDPARNGGPFMDAMIHNLNTARYLMGRPAIACTFFSGNLAHAGTLRCADTESMKLDFQGGGIAELFITWAADLAVHGTEGNDREHVETFSMVSEQGWRITKSQTADRAPVGSSDAGPGLIASRLGEIRRFPVRPVPMTAYDEFAGCVIEGKPLPRSIPGIEEAADDIRLIRAGMASVGRRLDLPLR